MSKRHASKLKEYGIARKVYLETHSLCEICCERPATQVHHKRKRGRYLNDMDTFCAACAPCHRKVHDNPRWAREQGFLA